jgi:hypothetical protein
MNQLFKSSVETAPLTYARAVIYAWLGVAMVYNLRQCYSTAIPRIGRSSTIWHTRQVDRFHSGAIGTSRPVGRSLARSDPRNTSVPRSSFRSHPRCCFLPPVPGSRISYYPWRFNGHRDGCFTIVSCRNCTYRLRNLVVGNLFGRLRAS